MLRTVEINWSLPRSRSPNSRDDKPDLVVPLERNLYGGPLAGLLWERTTRWSCVRRRMGERERAAGWGYTLRNWISFIGLRGWYGMAGNKARNKVEKGDEHCRFGRTNYDCWPSLPGMYAGRKWNKWMNCGREARLVHQTCFIHHKHDYEFQQWHQAQLNIIQLRDAGSCTKVRWTFFCELANRTTDKLHNVSTPCLDDHQLKNEDLETMGELSEVCSRIVLKCLYLALIGRPDILWTVNHLARHVTKWNRACDKRLAKLSSYTITPDTTDNFVMLAVMRASAN